MGRSAMSSSTMAAVRVGERKEERGEGREKREEERGERGERSGEGR